MMRGLPQDLRRQEMEDMATVLHLDLELDMGFPVDPEQPVTFPLLCDWVCTMAAVQPTGTSSFLGSGAVFQVGWKIITSSSCLESFLLLLFQGKAITAFLRGEWLLPLLLPDISYWLFFFFPSMLSHQTSCSVQFSSVTQSCPTLCYPTDCSMPGFPVHHQLPDLIQTHVHGVSADPTG